MLHFNGYLKLTIFYIYCIVILLSAPLKKCSVKNTNHSSHNNYNECALRKNSIFPGPKKGGFSILFYTPPLPLLI